MSSRAEFFNREMGGFAALVHAELGGYLPVRRTVRSGIDYNLASFSRDDELFFNFLEYTRQGLMFRTVEPQIGLIVNHWRVKEGDGKPVIERYLKDFKACQGVLEEEHPAVRARIESSLLIGKAIALRIREILGNFGNPEPDDYENYDLIQIIIGEERKGLMESPIKYENRRMIELCREKGLGYVNKRGVMFK